MSRPISAVDPPYREPGHRRILQLRPSSISGLLLTSFGLVALPLIAAILFGVIYVEQLTDQSERLVLQGVEVTRYSNRLNTLLLGMERSARQYGVLGSDGPMARFTRQAKEFDHDLDALVALQLETMPDWNLERLRARSIALAERMADEPEDVAPLLAEIAEMQQATARITEQGNLFIDRELARLQETAADARFFLLLCVFALIPGVLALTAFFVTVIARPLRQISAAVTQLGSGDFSQRIQIFAPTAELDALGWRLDWMRRRLATLENEKQQFIRHMSHELKTPLASIREGSELLRDGTVGPLNAAQSDVAEILQQNSLELAKLIDNLLGFAAWQQHHARLEYQRFDLRALFEAIVARQRLTIESKSLTIVLPRDPMEITADRDRMHLIVDNLLANAIKFSPPEGSIELAAEPIRSATCIRVTDAGPGVPEGERHVIFNAFYQGEQANPHPGPLQGTGIGLSVVRECVQAHGGQIEVDEAPGGGARFSIVIPNHHAE